MLNPSPCKFWGHVNAGWLSTLTVSAALGSGLVAGVFLGFSSVVMRSLARLPAPQGIAAMQSINTTVLGSLFLAIFLLTAMLSVLLSILALVHWNDKPSSALLWGSLLYLVGTFAVTLVFNVPLNTALEKVVPTSNSGLEVWTHYFNRWTAWNHVRTVAGVAATVGFMIALLRR